MPKPPPVDTAAALVPAPQGQIAELRRQLVESEGPWREAADLNALARRAALNFLKPLQREAILLRAEDLQAGLGYDHASLFERLLIEQLVTCWLHVELAQTLYGAHELTAGDLALARAVERRVAGAQRRYLKAFNALLDFRRKATPRGRATHNPGPPLDIPKPLEPPEDEDDLQEDDLPEEPEALARFLRELDQ